MPRRSRSNDLRAMDAYRRIHATIGERVVAPPADSPARRPAPGPGSGAGGVPGKLGSAGSRRQASPGPSRFGRGAGIARSRPGPSRIGNLDRPRPAGPVLTATAVIALLALLALAVGRLVVGSGSTPAPTAGRTTGPGTNASAANSTGRAAADRAGHGVHHAGTNRAHSAGATGARTTTTTASVIAPQSSTPAGASYVVPMASFTVQVTTTGACWVEVGPASSGPFSFVGTIPGGQQRAFPASSRLWIRLGAPGSVTVAVNGTPLQLSAPGSAPYNLSISAVGA